METEAETLTIPKLNEFINQQNGAEKAELIHTAAMGDNVVMIEDLLNSGCNINSRDSHGQTALAVALSCNKFLAAQCLLSKDEVHILSIDNDSRSALQICFQKTIPVPNFIIAKLLSKLNQCDLAIDEKANHLKNCPIEQVLLMDDPNILSLMLGQLTSITLKKSLALVNHAFELGNPEIMRVLLKRGIGSADRRRMFIDRARLDYLDPTIRSLFQRFINWNIIDRDLLSHIAWNIKNDCQCYVQAFLDVNLDNYSRRHFGLEILTRLFCNKVLDAIEVIESRPQFLVNGIDPFGLGALHWACMTGNISGITYLLEIGSDPNLRGRMNQTTLFYAANHEIIGLLLSAGADLLAVDDHGRSAVRNLGNYGYNELVSAHLGILKAEGLLKKELCDEINSLPSRIMYMQKSESCRKELLQMTYCWITEINCSLYCLLVGDPNQIADYVRSEERVTAILALHKFSVAAYSTFLKINLQKALQAHRLRLKAGAFFSQMLGNVDSSHLAIRQIVGYLMYNDLIVLIKLCRDLSF